MGTMVVAKLVERLLPNPDVNGSNPVIRKKIISNVNCRQYWKDENKEKEAGNSFENKMFTKGENCKLFFVHKKFWSLHFISGRKSK